MCLSKEVFNSYFKYKIRQALSGISTLGSYRDILIGPSYLRSVRTLQTVRRDQIDRCNIENDAIGWKENWAKPLRDGWEMKTVVRAFYLFLKTIEFVCP